MHVCVCFCMHNVCIGESNTDFKMADTVLERIEQLHCACSFDLSPVISCCFCFWCIGFTLLADDMYHEHVYASTCVYTFSSFSAVCTCVCACVCVFV